jgi:hypothetical protein
MQTETIAKFGRRVDAHVDAWSDAKYRRHFRAWAQWSGAKEDLFWSNHFGNTDAERAEQQARVRAAGERLLAL